jgi:hypothetical protein
MAGLTVNIDHVATLREIRKVAYPDPIASAVIAELAGADGISRGCSDATYNANSFNPGNGWNCTRY